MRLIKNNSRGDIIPFTPNELVAIFTFADEYEKYCQAEEKGAEAHEKLGDTEFQNGKACQKLDAARKRFLRYYNKAFNESLDFDMEFHMMDETKANMYYQAIMKD